jgi:predicted RNase H-like HicB family nuclease
LETTTDYADFAVLDGTAWQRFACPAGTERPVAPAGLVPSKALHALHCRAPAIELYSMHNEFTAIIERDGNWFIAQCPEVPEANGQGRTADEAKSDLVAAIRLVLEDRREDALKAASSDALRDVVTVGS